MIEDQSFTETLTLTLAQGASRCELLPLLGGSLGGWAVHGQEMLRPAGASKLIARDTYATAGFPLVPFSNRIAGGHFEWHGKTVTLARNFPPEPHAIHGVGFERSWQVQSRSANTALLSFRHRPDESWPWAFEARQRITVGDDSLTLDLSAVNLEPQAVPLAFGHHPYLPRAGALLTFQAQSVWLMGDDGLPGEQVEPSGNFNFSRGAPIERADIDHCFCGWGRAAYIRWPNKARVLEITASPELPCAVVYSRGDLDEFCFEPVPHMNDALNRSATEAAMPVVAPGESFSATLRFRAVKR